ncbi:MAG: serine hydrolase domain-containing protein, partial [Chitinophagaceae bacterium]
MYKIFMLLALCIALNFAAKATLYFPPTTGNVWDTTSLTSLGWCQDKMDSLINYLGAHHTKAFILLKDGKIVTEHYFGTFTVDSAWQWNSAGKSLTGFLIGLAQEQGYLNIHDSLPKYLHHGFSLCSTAAEDSIRLWNQLTMTTGFDDNGANGTESHCTDDTCLICIAAPGTRWAYHNAPYT